MSKPFYVKFEAPKELSDAAYEALQVAKDTGKIRKGTNESTKAVERGVAKLVLIAMDVEPPEVVAHLPVLCEDRKIPYIFVPSKARIGTSCGIDVGSAAACIVEPGDAAVLVQEVTEKLEVIRRK